MSGVQANLLLAGVQNASPWLSTDELQAPAKLAMAQQRNALLNRMDEQTLASQDMEMIARASAYLETLPDTAARQAAYPGIVSQLQGAGFAKNAPSVYPGDARISQLARMGTPSKELLEQAGLQHDYQEYLRTRGATGGGTTPAAPAATGGVTTPTSGSYEGAIGGHEGTGRNPRSTAYGTGQFLESTWLNFAAENPEMFPGMSQQQILAARSNPALGNTAINWLAQKNAQDLQAAGVAPSGQSLGIAHYLGSGAAAKIMQAGDAEPVRSYVSEAAVRANPELANMTVGQMRARYAGTPNPSFMTASTTTPGGQRVQVAAATPTVMTDGTTVRPTGGSGGVVATDGTTTPPAQQPPAATTAAVASVPAPPPRMQNGLTAEQNQTIAELQSIRPRTQADFAAQRQKIALTEAQFRQDNATADRQYRADLQSADAAARAARGEERQLRTEERTVAQQQDAARRDQRRLELVEDANRLANQKAADEAAAKNEPLQGNATEIQHERTLNRLAQKMKDGTATQEERNLYDGAYYALQQTGGQTGTMTGPGGSLIPFQTTRKLPPAFPEPSGGALPAVIQQPSAAKQEAMTAEQSKAAGFADRMHNALPTITDTSPAAMNRWQQLLGKVPLAGNSLVTEDFQRHMQSERDFINAILRRESGAAISPSEFDSARQQYIPQPGDGPKVLADKARARETVLNSLIRDAGPAYKAPDASGTQSQTTTAPSKVIKYDHQGNRVE